ncbi:hypothetical protein M8J77_022631 [Diaphorina citri]|nr:hypothetical protein M8J77_022631 [Diaphorina citri]
MATNTVPVKKIKTKEEEKEKKKEEEKKKMQKKEEEKKKRKKYLLRNTSLTLDPAGVRFGHLPPHEKLTADDARFVMVVHSSGDILSFSQPIGDADFYPNGGNTPQPKCSSVPDIFAAVICSHKMAPAYFADSLYRENSLVATPCESWVNYKAGNCGSNLGPSVVMGYNTPECFHFFETRLRDDISCQGRSPGSAKRDLMHIPRSPGSAQRDRKQGSAKRDPMSTPEIPGSAKRDPKHNPGSAKRDLMHNPAKPPGARSATVYATPRSEHAKPPGGGGGRSPPPEHEVRVLNIQCVHF